MTKNKECKSSIKKQSLNLDRKYLKIFFIMLIYGVTSLLVVVLILQNVPDLGKSTAEPQTKFFNFLLGPLGFGGVIILYMSVPFLIRTFWKCKGTFAISFIIMLILCWPLTLFTLYIPWGKFIEAVV
ncbi:MAG: hypothetical protein GKS07_07350 [Nitrosopumilus sp.]|nr:MAG: hypothetical protein GKS07_07350 [Nitrosopumilus sp.]